MYCGGGGGGIGGGCTHNTPRVCALLVIRVGAFVVQNRSLSVNSIGGRAPLPAAAAVIIQNEKDGKSTSE